MTDRTSARGRGTGGRAASPRADRGARNGFLDGLLGGSPARFMEPRVILVVVAAALMVFGFVMIFSASSVKALATTGDPAYFLKRQVIFAVVGIALAVLIAHFDYHVWSQRLVKLLWAGIVLLLMLTLATGVATKGATRWISLGFFRFQPSEFAKIVILLVAATLCQRFFEERSIDGVEFTKLGAVGVVLPMLLILVQPDKGTTGIVALTLVVMLYLAGAPRPVVCAMLAAIVLGIAVLALKDDYSRQRVMTMLDPERDPLDTGYQLLQGFYAFGNGGIFGVGIGLSRQKYAYLPEAHNDFIFAIVGEECGLVGTLLVVAAFGILVYQGYRIAKYAPDASGRLIAAGSTSLLGFQFLVNVGGILGLVPMTGKPLPFLSYGGSSIMSCCMLIGLAVSVSRKCVLPETDYDRRRSQLGVAPDTTGGYDRRRGGALPSGPERRALNSGRRSETSSPRGLRLVDGGAGRGAQGSQRSRIDLGSDPYGRLRGRGGTGNTSSGRGSDRGGTRR